MKLRATPLDRLRGSNRLPGRRWRCSTSVSPAHVAREMKPTFAKPAPDSMIEKLRSVHAVVEGLAD